MKRSLSLLFTSTALSLALGLPALAVIHAQPTPNGPCSRDLCASPLGLGDGSAALIRVSGDADDDDDDDHDDVDDDDCDDDDDDCKGKRHGTNPAPAGSVSPPANGLFGTGKPPVAVTN